MPSRLHETLVELFRERPGFAAELLAGPLGITVPTFERGDANGEARGEIRGEAKSVLKILVARSIEVTDEVRERILSCTDVDQLDIWINRALTATTADDLFS